MEEDGKTHFHTRIGVLMGKTVMPTAGTSKLGGTRGGLKQGVLVGLALKAARRKMGRISGFQRFREATTIGNMLKIPEHTSDPLLISNWPDSSGTREGGSVAKEVIYLGLAGAEKSMREER